jgi:5-hydroxyisourate hydrolase-like protein (transthyretin family)
MRKMGSAQWHGVKLGTLSVCLQICGLCAAQTPEGARPLDASVATKIAGMVVNSITGTPLAQSRVTISDTKQRGRMKWVVTSENGRFEFDQLPAGKYSLEGAKRGFLTAGYQQHEQFSTAIVTGTEFDTTGLVLRLTPMASIEGKVLDESGEAVREAMATLYEENHDAGMTRVSAMRSETTDDLGRFEFGGLRPGKYIVSVTAKPWYAVHVASVTGEGGGNSVPAVDRSLDVTYPTTYSGGATETDGAVPMEVKGGELREVEITVFPVPSLHLILRVAEEDEQHGVPPPRLEKRVFDSVEYIQTNEFRRLGKGLYELSSVPAGTYSVSVQNPGPQQQTARTGEVDLRTDGQELDTTTGMPEGSLKLTIQMPQQEPIPKQMQIALQDAQGRVVGWSQSINANGETAMQNLPAGKYAIHIYATEKRYAVAKTVSGAGQTAGHEVEMLPGGSLELTAVLAEGSANVEGFAKREGKGASGVMVVLIPREPGTHEELFRRDQSDSDGSFNLPNVIPGKYTLVAIEDAWGFDWSKPAQLAQYAQRGQAVTIPEGPQTTIQLPEAIEVQPQ